MKKVLATGVLFLAATLTIFAQDSKNDNEKGKKDHSKRYEYLSEKLNLNEQQVESIKKIDENYFVKMQEQRKEQKDLRKKILLLEKKCKMNGMMN